MKSCKTGIALMVGVQIFMLASGLLHAEIQGTANIAAKDGDNFIVASFTYLMAQKVSKPRYILVLVPGFNGNGSRFLQHQQWRAFAESTEGAIVACTYKALPEESPDEINNYVHYAAAQYGSGAALEAAIDQFDAMDPAHSLKDLPLLIYGHSAGGQFAYGFSCHNPKRMIGFAAAKGGYYYPEPITGTYQVPGLLVSGEQDLARRRKEIRSLFESHRKQGAPWCWMEDASGHGTARTLDVILPYFRDLLQLRLAADSKTLKAISKNDGVTVDLKTKKLSADKAPTAGNEHDVESGFLPSVNVFGLWALQDVGKRKYIDLLEKTDKK